LAPLPLPTLVTKNVIGLALAAEADPDVLAEVAQAERATVTDA
jgi:hypothetical protein